MATMVLLDNNGEKVRRSGHPAGVDAQLGKSVHGGPRKGPPEQRRTNAWEGSRSGHRYDEYGCGPD
ncbi:MAG: hypothetical protein UT69_C0002G0009 [Candidatus Yanofskybacteria bacterium GW2011_GWE1_40_10]|nr:MAG: hypothetical protein UT69_C0002G0009 [Candidatus Yanofskybacteria bacterium GW2011_GWE1_40_10]